MELKIIDISYSPSGSTILSYTNNEPRSLIKSGCFNLVIEGEIKETIWIAGGVLVSRKDWSKPYPRLATTGDPSIKKYPFEKDKWILVSVPKSNCGKESNSSD